MSVNVKDEMAKDAKISGEIQAATAAGRLFIHNFTNELERPIRIVTYAGAEGVSIAYSIAAPGSLTESHLTRREAEYLHAALGQVLAAAH